MISLIVGLGNPGEKYIKTRHNAGFWLLDNLADKYQVHWLFEKKFQSEYAKIQINEHAIFLCKPQTFMNASGRAVISLGKFYGLKPENILVVHDELDLPEGTVRFKFSGGHGGHNGLRDIISSLGSKDFYRLRIGIGRPSHNVEVINYVLSPPSKTSYLYLERAIQMGEEGIIMFLREGIEKAMHWLHRQKAGE